MNYERDYSHVHCYDETETPACGRDPKKHLACCICAKPTPDEQQRALDELTKVSEEYELYD